MTQDGIVYCDRCGVGTEHFWSYKSKLEQCDICNDCLVNLISYLISNGIISPHKIVDWTKANAPQD